MSIRERFRHRQPYTCAQLVEAITEYLEDAMPRRDRARVEEHLWACEGCDRYLAQIRRTIELTGRLTVDDVDALGAGAREALLGAFREAQP